MGRVEIVYATNEEYLPILGVSVFSLIQHANPARDYRITILIENIPYTQQMPILVLQRLNVTIRFIDVSQWMKGYDIQTVAYYSREVVYRLLVDRIFTGDENVLYLDADTLICKDVAELYDVDLVGMGKTIGAVPNASFFSFIRNHIHEALQLPIETYFNSGVVVMQVGRFHARKIGERALQMLTQRRYDFPDQDVLNILCQDDVMFLDNRWNVQWEVAITSETEKLSNSDWECVREVMSHPYILHYTTYRKPWMYPEYQFADAWWKVARMSGFAVSVAVYVRRKIEKERGVFGRFAFPWHLVKSAERIYLYGGGAVGTSYAWQLELTQYAELLGVIDRHPENVQGMFAPIFALDAWKTAGYQGERIVIAVEKQEIAEAIRKDLRAMDVSDECILWASPNRT